MPRNYCGRVDCGCDDVEAETCPLGAGHAHIYVTRGATLAYSTAVMSQGLPRPLFETARRELTKHLLRAEPVPGDRRRFTFGARGVDYVAYVVPEGDLLVVGNVSLVPGAPEVYGSDPPENDRAARWDRFLRDGGVSETMEEVRILRAALHGMASDWLAGQRPPDYVFQDTQSYVDYYVATERTKK